MPATKRTRLTQPFAAPATWPHGAAEAWAAAQEPVSLLSAPNPRADWRATTGEGVQQGYRRWLRWSIERRTFPSETSFVGRVTRGELEDYVKDLRSDIADSTISTSLAFLKMALRAMAPKQDWSWMDPAISSVKRSAKPVRHKRRRLVSMHDLVALGYDLMEGSGCRTGDVPSQEQATKYRDSLEVALMAVRPSRLANFSGIIIGQHLQERDGCYWLNFGGGETKNHDELDQQCLSFYRSTSASILSRFGQCWPQDRTGVVLPQAIISGSPTSELLSAAMAFIARSRRSPRRGLATQ